MIGMCTRCGQPCHVDLKLCEGCEGYRVEDFHEGLSAGMADALPMPDPTVTQAARRVVEAYAEASSVVDLIVEIGQLRLALGLDNEGHSNR